MKLATEITTIIVIGFLAGIGMYLGESFCRIVFN